MVKKASKATITDFANQTEDWTVSDSKDFFKNFVSYLENMPVEGTINVHGLGTFIKKKNTGMILNMMTTLDWTWELCIKSIIKRFLKSLELIFKM